MRIVSIAAVGWLLLAGCSEPIIERCKGLGCPHIVGEPLIAVRDSTTGALVAGPRFSTSTATRPLSLVAASCLSIADAGICDSWSLRDDFFEATTVTATALGYKSGSIQVQIADPDQCCVDSPDVHFDLLLDPERVADDKP